MDIVVLVSTTRNHPRARIDEILRRQFPFRRRRSRRSTSLSRSRSTRSTWRSASAATFRPNEHPSAVTSYTKNPTYQIQTKTAKRPSLLGSTIRPSPNRTTRRGPPRLPLSAPFNSSRPSKTCATSYPSPCPHRKTSPRRKRTLTRGRRRTI